jgi:hypothetical protein
MCGSTISAVRGHRTADLGHRPANRLGHARTSTTLDIYWAWVPARDLDAAHHLKALLG